MLNDNTGMLVGKSTFWGTAQDKRSSFFIKYITRENRRGTGNLYIKRDLRTILIKCNVWTLFKFFDSPEVFLTNCEKLFLKSSGKSGHEHSVILRN